MQQQRLSGEHRVALLQKAELKTPVGNLIRRLPLPSSTSIAGRSRTYKGLESEHVRERKQLQEENTRLKRVVADLTMDTVMLQDGLAKTF